jgi:hypothetical protein
MSDQSAIRMLQTAIENVRENCTGPEYKALLAACAACDAAAEKALNDDDGDEPRTLRQASDRARQTFKEARK